MEFFMGSIAVVSLFTNSYLRIVTVLFEWQP